jgi:probable F420-dependent oxidoreductase
VHVQQLRIHSYLGSDLRRVPAEARRFEELGFDGVMTGEASHDPFLPLLLAAEHTSRLRLMTGIAVAFARNPMLLAMQAHDLNAYSGGRFTLGLGSQIQAHVTRRFSMPWSKPAPRMREMIAAIRAIFADWYDGVRLDFKGEFYTHTLMTPTFRPTNTEFGKPSICCAAVGPLMTSLAGEIADGLYLHSFSSEAYIRIHSIAALEASLASAQRPREAVRVCYWPFLVTGATTEIFENARQDILRRIAFYASTPAYRPVLEQHGWGELQPRLQEMTREGRWGEMARLITPEILETLAVVGEPRVAARIIWERYGDLVQDLVLASDVVPPETLAEIAAEIRGESGKRNRATG